MTSDVSCRILLVASSIELGERLIDRVKSYSDERAPADHDPLDSDPSAGSYALVGDSVESDDLMTELWTIRNKYYTADVHFGLCTAREWRVRHAFGVPAIVVAWADGETYESTLDRIHSDLMGSNLDPEVCLAVRLASASASPATSTALANPPPPSATSATTDEDDIDELIASFSFEYVDARQSSTTKVPTDEMSDIPGLPRVLDALSTIMWPSMVQAPRAAARQSRSANFLGLADDSLGEAALTALIRRSEEEDGDGKELAMLERWLDDDDENLSSVADDERNLRNLSKSSPLAGGFDDDFAEFVTAQPAASGSSHEPTLASTSTLPLFELHDVDGSSSSIVTSFSPTYDFDAPRSPLPTRALHPVKLQNDLDQSSTVDDDDDEVTLPSRPEVLSTSARIFGSATGTVPETEDVDDDGPVFDLNRVLASLEGMKAEIAGIEDENERRQAAARVALGLVHGLGLE